MTKCKATEFDVLRYMKSMPPEFWTKVPTYDKRYYSDYLRDHKYVEIPNKFTRPQSKKVAIKSQAETEFPEYRELCRNFLNVSENYELHYVPDFKNKPLQDWVEWKIEDILFRIGMSDTHEFYYRGKWQDSIRVKYNSEEYVALQKAYKQPATLWNRLRKKYRVEAGIDNTPEVAAKKAKEELVKQQANAKKECIKHIEEMHSALKQHSQNIEDEKVTREGCREIFDLQNEMTSLNKKLKDAFKVR